MTNLFGNSTETMTNRTHNSQGKNYAYHSVVSHFIFHKHPWVWWRARTMVPSHKFNIWLEWQRFLFHIGWHLLTHRISLSPERVNWRNRMYFISGSMGPILQFPLHTNLFINPQHSQRRPAITSLSILICWWSWMRFEFCAFSMLIQIDGSNQC